MVAPPIIFVAILALWMIIAFVASSSVDSNQVATGMRFMNISLGLLGIISLLALPIGIVVGMVLLLKKDKQVSEKSSHVDQ